MSNYDINSNPALVKQMLTLEEIEKLFADDAVLGNTVYVIYDRPDCLHDLPPSEYGSEPSEQH